MTTTCPKCSGEGYCMKWWIDEKTGMAYEGVTPCTCDRGKSFASKFKSVTSDPGFQERNKRHRAITREEYLEFMEKRRGEGNDD